MNTTDYSKSESLSFSSSTYLEFPSKNVIIIFNIGTSRPETQDTEMDEDVVSKPPEPKRPRQEEESPSVDVEISEEQLSKFKTVLFAAFEASHQQQV